MNRFGRFVKHQRYMIAAKPKFALSLTPFHILLLLPLVLGNLSRTAEIPNIRPEHIPPRLAQEFRGAWIASAGNIDWPSKPGLSADQQKDELIGLLDRAAQLRLNAIFFQVRPACDALYSSELEPWSIFLSGKIGQPPGYDPLAFAIEQAHARGLELHAWFNPYRAGYTAWKEIPSNHIIKAKPHLVRRYASFYWLDPGETEVQDHTTRVILDVVRRYNIDGVHLDDYFYPYPEKRQDGKFLEFPDNPSWSKYRTGGGHLARNDWRRDSVNQLVQRLHREVKQEKPWVAFGVSPFGIWRPGYPAQVKGLDAYEAIYADARLWLTSGWVDYLAPQLYWPIDPPEQSFTALLHWWHEQNARKIPIWPGGSVARVGTKVSGHEILRQVQHARATATPGYIHWNLSSLVRNKDRVGDRLRDELYGQPALVPPSAPGAAILAKPILTVQGAPNSDRLITWTIPPNEQVAFWVLQVKSKGAWHTQILPVGVNSYPMRKGGAAPEVIAVSALNRYRVLSPVALLPL